MSGKIIDLDPNKRLTKEAFERIKGVINEFEPDALDNFVLLYTDKEGKITFEAFGVDWFLLGIGEAYLEDLRRKLLYDDAEEPEDS